MRWPPHGPLIAGPVLSPPLRSRSAKLASSWPGFWMAIRLRMTPSCAFLSWSRTHAVHSRSREPGGHFRVSAEVRGSRVRVEVLTKAAPGNGPHTKTSSMAAACSSSPSSPTTAAATETPRRDGWSGSRSRRMTSGQPGAGPRPGAARPPPQTFILDGQRLRQLRRQRGLSQEELADQAGVSLTTVAGWNGRRAHPAVAGLWAGLPGRSVSTQPPPRSAHLAGRVEQQIVAGWRAHDRRVLVFS